MRQRHLLHGSIPFRKALGAGGATNDAFFINMTISFISAASVHNQTKPSQGF